MIDARPFEFLEGMNQHHAATEAGTIPGALSLEHSVWFETFASGGTRIAVQDVSEQLAALTITRNAPDKSIAMFCNVGRWSATNWFMLSEVAKLENVKLYPEGMVGWTKAGRETVVME
jgi:thiosulfate/3-mercaptopyruvate sulfurtransferase